MLGEIAAVLIVSALILWLFSGMIAESDFPFAEHVGTTCMFLMFGGGFLAIVGAWL